MSYVEYEIYYIVILRSAQDRVPSFGKCPMEQSKQPWSAAILLIVVLLAAVPIYALFRIWRGRPRLTDQERTEAAASPLTLLQRIVSVRIHSKKNIPLRRT